MKKLIYLSFLILAMACKAQVSDQSVSKVIPPDEFKQKIAELSEKGTAFQLLDVRTSEENQNDGGIEGAVNIDFYGDSFQAELDKLNKDIPTLVYCRSGGRSGKTAVMMKEKGFKEVYDLEGGMNKWAETMK